VRREKSSKLLSRLMIHDQNVEVSDTTDDAMKIQSWYHKKSF